MAKKYDFDLIAIGGGSGGVRAARMAAGFGARAALVEEKQIGGTCVNRGCVPKKLLVHAANFANDFKDAQGFGWSAHPPSFDWPSLIIAKNREVSRLNAAYAKVLKDGGVKILEGRGVLSDPHTVEVKGKPYTARYILIATGSRPVMPQIPGIEHVITSNEALDLMTLPKRMTIIGAGYIAVEFACIFNALGVQVTVIMRGDKVLRGFDGGLRTKLGEEMVKQGINLRSKTEAAAIEKTASGYVLTLKGGERLTAGLVMYATGRAPNTKGLGLEEAGVKLDEKGAVAVNEYSMSSCKNVFAAGDATNRLNLTPAAIAEAAALAETLFNGNPTAVDHDNTPTAVFSLPPLSSVGLTEERAKALYKENIDIYESSFRPLKHALSGRNERSFVKLVVHAKTSRVLGCHMLGQDAPEIMQGFALALKCRAKKSDFGKTAGIHPTSAEEFMTLRLKRSQAL